MLRLQLSHGSSPLSRKLALKPFVLSQANGQIGGQSLIARRAAKFLVQIRIAPMTCVSELD
jgi:hypothetical protein